MKPDGKQYVAERLADRLVGETDAFRMRHFSVISERKRVPFPTHWTRKNTAGVSFSRDRAQEARAWVLAALLTGFTVFYVRRKHGPWFGCSIESEMARKTYSPANEQAGAEIQ
jgi:hypothetical protein